MSFDGIHHVTCITGDAPGNVDFYTGIARPAAREEDGQPGRPDRLPPLLRGRAGDARAPTSRSSSTRAPRRAARAPGWSTRSSGASARRRRSTSGPSGCGVERDGRHRRASRIPEGLRHELVVAHVPDEPLIADHPEIPRELALQGFEGVRAYARDADAAHGAVPRAARLRARRRTTGHARRLARRLDRVRRARPSGRHSRRRHRAPRRVGVDDGRSRGLAESASPTRAAARRRSSTASGSARSTSASRAASSSRSRRSARVRDRRGSGASRREADPAAGVRAPARRGRADAHAAAEPARAQPGRLTASRARDARRRRAARARSSCSTDAAPTSTICSRCSTRSTRSGGCTATRRARRSRCRRAARTGTTCRASATPIPRRSRRGTPR